MPLPPSIQSMIEREADEYARTYSGTKLIKRPYVAGATAILQEPGRYGLAGAWIKGIDIEPQSGLWLNAKKGGTPIMVYYAASEKIFIDTEGNFHDPARIEWLSDTPAAPVDKGVVEALELAEVELKAMYKRLGFKGGNVLDRITDELKKYGK